MFLNARAVFFRARAVLSVLTFRFAERSTQHRSFANHTEEIEWLQDGTRFLSWLPQRLP